MVRENYPYGGLISGPVQVQTQGGHKGQQPTKLHTFPPAGGTIFWHVPPQPVPRLGSISVPRLLIHLLIHLL